MSDKPLMDKLRDQKKELENEVLMARMIYDTSKKNVQNAELSLKNVQNAELSLKKAKSNNYRAYKDLKSLKKEVEKLDKKIKTLPTYLRTWAKNNPGKALNIVMKNNGG
jgi:uncharacterized protein (DUF3084 family)